MKAALRGLFTWCGIGVALCMLIQEAAAGTVSVESASIPGLDARNPIVIHTLRVTGMIEPRDAERLRAILERLRSTTTRIGDRPLAIAQLSSPGGDLMEGLKIGYLFREFEIGTIVRKGDTCQSACALAFLGGTASRLPPRPLPSRSIEIGGQVAFHGISTDAAIIEKETAGNTRAGITRSFGLARAGASAMIGYGADMSIDAGFIGRLLGGAPDTWQYIETDEEFLSVRACPVGQEPPLGRLEQQAVNVCNHATGWFSVASPSQASAMSSRQSKRHLLEHVQQNIESFNVKGPLVTQLRAVIASKDERLVESVYDDLRAAGIALPEQFERNLHVTGYMSGATQLQCHVTLDVGEPDRFDLVILGPTGLLRAFQAPPRACPRLFRYDRQEVLNPRR